MPEEQTHAVPATFSMYPFAVSHVKSQPPAALQDVALACAGEGHAEQYGLEQPYAGSVRSAQNAPQPFIPLWQTQM